MVSPEKVVTISANIDAGQPWRRTVGDYNVVYTDWQRDNYFKAVAQEIPNRGRVGIEFDHLPVERLNKLKAVVKSIEKKEIKKNPGKLFSLSNLQSHLSKKNKR